MLKLLLHRSYEVGRLINTDGGVYRIAAHGQSYGCFLGGSGVHEMSLELIKKAPQPLTVGELRKLDEQLKSQGALVIR